MPHRILRVTALGAVLAVAWYPAASTRRHGNEGHIRRGCIIRETARERLSLVDGRRVYIEPVVLAANSRGDLLLAGQRNLLERRAGGPSAGRASGDSLLGAIVPRSGPVRLVPSPIPSRLLNGVGAVARPDGTWAVVFGETGPYSGPSRPDTVARLWFGVFDGAAWTELEHLPAPPEALIRAAGASALIAYGDTLAWALRTTTPQHPDDVIVYERRGGAWTYEIVPTVVSAYSALAHSDSMGLLLFHVGPDLSLPSDRNSLFLWARHPGWGKIRKVVSSSVEEVFNPQVRRSGAGHTLNWIAEIRESGGTRREAHAMVGRLETGRAQVISLDSAMPFAGSLQPVELRRGLRLWVLEHSSHNGGREVRVVRDSSAVSVPMYRAPSPFATGFVAAATGSSDLVVTGADYDPVRQSVASMLIRYRVEC